MGLQLGCRLRIVRAVRTDAAATCDGTNWIKLLSEKKYHCFHNYKLFILATCQSEIQEGICTLLEGVIRCRRIVLGDGIEYVEINKVNMCRIGDLPIIKC